MEADTALKTSHFESEDPTFQKERKRADRGARRARKGVSFVPCTPHASSVMLKGMKTKWQDPLGTQERALRPEGTCRQVY